MFIPAVIGQGQGLDVFMSVADGCVAHVAMRGIEGIGGNLEVCSYKLLVCRLKANCKLVAAN
jgi:hypothetical protein